MDAYLIVVAHVGAALGLVCTGFNLYAMMIDRRRDRPRLVISARVRDLIVAGGALPTDREGPHVIVEAVNAGPGPITVTGCEASLEPVPGDNRNMMIITNAAPESPPYEVTHGKSITFLMAMKEPLPGDPTEVRVYDTLGRVWSPSKGDVKAFRDDVRKHRADHGGGQ